MSKILTHSHIDVKGAKVFIEIVFSKGAVLMQFYSSRASFLICGGVNVHFKREVVSGNITRKEPLEYQHLPASKQNPIYLLGGFLSHEKEVNKGKTFPPEIF